MFRKHKKDNQMLQPCFNDKVRVVGVISRICLNKIDDTKYKNKPSVYLWQTGGVF